MKIETINLDNERKLIILLIMNNKFCDAVIPVLKPETLSSPYAKTVAGWIQEYYAAYKTAPEKSIFDVYTQHVSLMHNEELSDSIKVFLDKVVAEYDPNMYTNLPFYIKEATVYLRAQNLNEHCIKVSALTSSGKLDQAEAEIAKFNQIGVPQCTGISLLRDTDRIITAMAAVQEPLFRFPGALGIVCGDFFRQDFCAALSTMKGGKSWFLQYLDESAALSGLKVCHIDLEMRVEEPLQRFVRGILAQPLDEGDISVPKFVCFDEVQTDTSMYRIEHQIIHKMGVSRNKEKLQQELSYRLHDGGDIMLFSMPSGATTVKDIESLLDNLERYQNYVPDVLTIDYCDVMGSYEKDYRQKLNDIWINLRRVAQQRNIFVSTVTQSTRAGVSGKELNSEDISEDIRKLAHVTNFLGLYSTDDQKKNDYCFVKCFETRTRRQTWDSAVVLQCLDIGRWCIDSRLKSQFCE
jgi:hypothetical protein